MANLGATGGATQEERVEAQGIVNRRKLQGKILRLQRIYDQRPEMRKTLKPQIEGLQSELDEALVAAEAAE